MKRSRINKGVNELNEPIEEKDYLTASQAAEYLAKKWGFESYSASAFRLLRWRRNQEAKTEDEKLNPDIDAGNGSLWKRSTLDTIPKPDKTKPRPKRKKKKQQAAGDASV